MSGGWFDPPRLPTPEEQAALERRVREAYERRQRGLILARSRGPIRFVGRQVRRLGPWIVLVLYLTGLAVVGLSATLRSALLGAIAMPWYLGLALLTLVAGLALTAVLATGLWFHIRARLFPHLPAETGGSE